jgi:hypothetical protein
MMDVISTFFIYMILSAIVLAIYNLFHSPDMKAWFDVRFGLPMHPFISEVLRFYNLELSHLSYNFLAQLRIFIWLCETTVKDIAINSNSGEVMAVAN